MSKSDDNSKIENWLDENNVQDIEVLVSDFAGISRGKKMPVGKFLKSLGGNDLRMPDCIMAVTIDCDFIGNDYITALEEDVYLEPDFSTLGLVPWHDNATAYIICDLKNKDGSAFNMTPRQVLRNVLALYEEKAWKPIIAPEFEFHLLAGNDGSGDPIQAVAVASGRSGRPTDDKGVMSLDGLAEYGALFDDVHRYCKIMGLPMDALVQEAGVGQFEFNIGHDEALKLADAVFQFKRIMKWAATKHGFCATFMAKPYPDDYGNAMHIHQSVIDVDSGANIFADENGDDTKFFHAHIAGLQKYASAAMLFFAPYENSYLRYSSKLSCPANTHWGVENRSVGLRVPEGGGASRRIENRIAGADTNPYLAVAASLLCGYLGMTEELKPSEPVIGSAYDLATNGLPQHIYASVDALEHCDPFRDLLGDEFIRTFLDVKKAEIKARSNVLSSWDIKYLLTNV